MNDTYVTLIGNVVGEIRSATTANGVPMAKFRFGVSPRRFDRERNEWTYGDSSYYTVVAWRRLAEHTLSSVDRGDPLVVTGRLNVREWMRDDRWHVNAEVEAWSLGHDLTRGTSRFTRAGRRDPDTQRTLAAAAERPEPPGRPEESALLGEQREPASSPAATHLGERKEHQTTARAA
ncbi:single-stranded DNA-binding protein [Yinghuangia soli]|uniref:Single-stranded DNA-binding protein n=1 Tax=Yinghuangia soli TaxID=2908204 RepID=A0AA41Q522_9ACTN|nr:single-stranded DNA-binding protein [Yinghuangia soli]MCF2531709.1 single-stranded DNA-binding protein [Yinghuangia soli]